MIKLTILFLIFIFATSLFAQNQNDNKKTAENFIESLFKKDFAAAYGFFADAVKKQVPVEAMPQAFAQITDAFGEFKSLKELKPADGKNLIAVIEFEKRKEEFLVSFDGAGKILGFTVSTPPNAADKTKANYETPKYADPNSFTESEVTIGAGEWALPGTLTMPKNKTNVPAIVLVHGSGPNDRDETHINKSNKIFKDLAWGLASKGIAVLRYDKRTFVYGNKLASVKKFTVKEETVDDALLAVELLRKTPNVDTKKIYVLGHSLGGYLIPRIGERDKKIAGLIVFAGTTRPLEDVILEQTEYLISVDGNVSEAEKAYLENTKKNAAEIKALKPSDADSVKFLEGLSASYWLDLKNYDPTLLAQKLKQPMLILQGESDYQVTMKDFDRWKNALGTNKSVAFKTYPNLTHTFMETAGDKPSPKDYQKTNHVNETVIGDIAAWILKNSK